MSEPHEHSTPDQTEHIEPAAPPPRGILVSANGLIYGPNGLRAGWRVVCFLIALIVVAGVLHSLRAGPPRTPRNHTSAVAVLTTKAFEFAAVVVTTLLFALVERRRPGVYGLPLRRASPLRFSGGSLLGFASIAIVIELLTLAQYASGRRQLYGIEALRFALLWAAAFLAVALAEEFLFRGYMLVTLSRGMGFWPAAGVTSLLFALTHSGNPGETRFGLFQVALFGVTSCIVVYRTGDLWVSVGYHAFWDWGQSYFFGVADSGTIFAGSLFRTTLTGPEYVTGGSAGPEGSVIVSVMLLTISVLTLRMRRPVHARSGDV